MNKYRLIIIGLTFSIFVFLSIKVVLFGHFVVDYKIMSLISGVRSPLLNSFMTTITYIANWQSIVFLCLVFLVIPYTRKTFGIQVALFCLASTLLNEILKALFLIQRPLEELRLISVIGYTFPSGHAMTGLLFYSLMIIVIRKYLIKNRPIANLASGLLVIFILLIGFSRVYLGVHFPSDVLAGYSVGLILALLFEPTADRFARKYIRNQG
jgi:undecaprenyl-diphosphatase